MHRRAGRARNGQKRRREWKILESIMALFRRARKSR